MHVLLVPYLVWWPGASVTPSSDPPPHPTPVRSIDAAELKVVLQSLGEYKDEAQLQKLIKEVDRDNNGTVEFSEFCWIAYQIRAGGNGAALFQKVYTLQKEMLSYEFSAADVAALKAQFATFDTSKDGRCVRGGVGVLEGARMGCCTVWVGRVLEEVIGRFLVEILILSSIRYSFGCVVLAWHTLECLLSLLLICVYLSHLPSVRLRPRSIDATELGAALKKVGEYKDDAQVATLMHQVDRDGSGTIEFTEFCWCVAQIRSGALAADQGFAKVFSAAAGAGSQRGGAGAVLKPKGQQTWLCLVDGSDLSQHAFDLSLHLLQRDAGAQNDVAFSDKLVALHVFDSAKYCDKKFPVALRHDKIRAKFETLMVGSVCVFGRTEGQCVGFERWGFCLLFASRASCQFIVVCVFNLSQSCMLSLHCLAHFVLIFRSLSLSIYLSLSFCFSLSLSFFVSLYLSIYLYLSLSLSFIPTHPLILTLAALQAARGHGEVIVREVGSGQRARNAIAQISQEIKADILVLGIFGRKHESGAHKVCFTFC
jgi:hypothetical protein